MEINQKKINYKENSSSFISQIFIKVKRRFLAQPLPWYQKS